jgi:hypothetical protein
MTDPQDKPLTYISVVQGSRGDPARIQISFPRSFLSILGKRVRVEGKVLTGLIVICNAQAPEVPKSLGVYTIDDYGPNHLYLNIHHSFSGFPRSQIHLTERQRIEYIIADGRILFDDINLAETFSREPRTITHRIPPKHLRDNAPVLYDMYNRAIESSAPIPIPPAIPDEITQIRAAIAYIQACGGRPLFDAVLTLHKLCGKNRVHLRLDSNGKLIATREEKL